MIATVAGVVAGVRLDSAVIEVGGVGLLVQCTPRTAAGLRVGSLVSLQTALVVREDSLTLFGFVDADERHTFDLLQTAGGVGPRLALAMLAVHTPDQLRRAVAGSDLAALTAVPGIGRKGAEKIVVELRDRLGPPSVGGDVIDLTPGSDGSGPGELRAGEVQVVEALVGLGWNAREARAAVDAVVASPTATGDRPELDRADLLRAALQGLRRT
jgi:holliday junction DNA helicase RuvA